jgi:hypothetical protein
VRLEGLGKLKNPMISEEFKLVTFWFVAQRLNQLMNLAVMSNDMLLPT